MKVRAHPLVYDELEHYRSWYDSKARHLGTDFVEEVDYAVKRIAESPETWPWYDKTIDVRKFLVHRFPFGVIYRNKIGVVQVLAIADLRRKPGYWKDRLSFFG